MTQWNYRLPNKMHDLFCRLPQKTISQIHRHVARDSKKMSLLYLDKNGNERIIPLMLRPRVMSVKQRNYLWKTTQILNEAFSKIPQLYFDIPAAQEIFPFEDGEAKWVHDILPALNHKHLENLSRWDGNTDFSGKNWAGAYHYFENNAVGVGGVWYCPVAELITLKEIYPELKKIDPKLSLAQNDDARILLLKLMRRCAKNSGVRDGHHALTVDRDMFENYVEFPMLAKYLKGHGLDTLVCDPRDLYLKKDEIFARGKKVSLVYRDTTLAEYFAMEEKGADMSALKLAFKQNRVISSLSGEFDHKSAFELFSSATWTQYFSAKERAIFSKHILWTRLVRESRTDIKNGKVVDLIPYVRKQKDAFVLKPNRLFGGEGVEIGKLISQRAWDQELEKGLKNPGYMIVQELAHVPVKRFPVHRGTAQDEERYTVVGIISTPDGMTVVGRVAKKKVVNIAQDGGLTAVLLCQNI
ncbi:MAG: hypothetical protein HY586_07205 [Candidatus Omnitrophica bacterium]|nr:hypothetical protein [Candidatus Omnitrophota bacterium]